MITLADINADIADMERKLRVLRDLAAVYQGDAPESERPASTAGLAMADARRRSVPPVRRPSGKSAEILDLATLLVEAGQGEPVSTKTIWECLRADKVIEPSYKPNALSALISNSKRFDPNGREGWTLKRPSSEQELAPAGGLEVAPQPPAGVLPAGPPQVLVPWGQPSGAGGGT